jgi:hypothetical protein
MKADLLASGYIQADETPVPYHDPDACAGQTGQGWMWVLGRPEREVVLTWRLSRRHGELGGLLAGYRGLLHADGYEAYTSFALAHADCVVQLGCWVHARRRFHEALEEAPREAGFILRLIGHLYGMEAQWDRDGYTEPAQRAHLRSRDFAPTLSLLRKAAQLFARRALPRSLLGKACAYLLHHWKELIAHQRFGQSRLDTNSVENAIRPTKLVCKNWLFIGHPDAGDRSAILYSLLISCQRLRIDPHAYLKDVLTRLPAMTNRDDLAALTPARWKPPAPT